MKRQTSVIFYFLGVYVVLQFVWWGYHLIELTSELEGKEQLLSKRVTMIIGEGLVFLSLLIFGLWKIQSSIRKELKLAERQKNFLLSVTHELKTPLAANKLFWQTIEKRDLNPEQKKEIIQKALQENHRLETLIDNILNASRIENKALHIIHESVDLSDLIAKVTERYEKRNTDLKIDKNIEPDVIINSDASLVETIIGNLIENAIKYAGKQTKIIVYLKKGKDKVSFGVIDEGLGVPKAQQKAIFSKFYRGENEETRSQKGTGLGLFITAEFTRLLGGKISYKDNNPKGAIFDVTLNV